MNLSDMLLLIKLEQHSNNVPLLENIIYVKINEKSLKYGFGVLGQCCQAKLISMVVVVFFSDIEILKYSDRSHRC